MVVLGGVADDPTHKPGDSNDHSRQQHKPGLPEKTSNNVSCDNGNGLNPFDNMQNSVSDPYKYYYDPSSESDWQSTSSPSSTRQMLGDHLNRYGSSFRSSSVTSSQTHRPWSSSSSRRFRVPFVKKIDWASLWDKSKEWIRNPMNMALSVWILAVGVSGAILFMIMTGMLNRVLPNKPQRDTWFEVNNQILNALFTLMCLYQHPRRFYHLALLCRWRAGDMHQLRQVYCKDGSCKPNERKHMMVVILLLHLNCFAQYALCGLNLGYRRPQRPVIGVALTISVAIGAPAVAGLYNNLSPLGKDYEAQPGADDEESQLQRKTPETERRYSLVPRQGHGGSTGSSPQWVGGLFDDLWEDVSLAYLSVFCSCCVFGWNMNRLGLGNMYVHIATFVLLCLAPFFIFDLAAISVDDEAVRDALGLAGVFLCVLGLLYGGFWRIQMRRRFSLPENRACCGKPDLTDCMQWLCCYSCALAQEVRTADAYEVVLVVQDTTQEKPPMPMQQRHHPTLQEELSTMQEPLRFAGVFASSPLTPTASATRSVDDGVTVPPSSVSATRT